MIPEVGSQKIYVSFDGDADLKRGVDASRRLGGMKFLGVATEPQAKITFAVFEAENDASRLMADILSQGVRIRSVVVKTTTEGGATAVHGLVPVAVRCDGCGRFILYEDSFSRTGVQLCDACMAKAIEVPASEEGEA